jgi:hypothetical protein
MIMIEAYAQCATRLLEPDESDSEPAHQIKKYRGLSILSESALEPNWSSPVQLDYPSS